MLAKTTDKGGQDWDTRLPYVLFAYRCSMQSSTMESPFFLLYGHDPRLPTKTALTAPIRAEVDVGTYKEKVVQGLVDLLSLMCAGHRTDRRRYMINMQLHHPSKLETECSFMSQQQSPPRPTSLQDLLVGRIALYACSGADIRPVDKPQKAAIRVSLNRLCPCPVEIVN